MSVSECGQSWEKYVTALSLWGTGFLCLGDPILIKHHWGDSTSNQWLSYRFGPKWTSSHFLLIYFCSNFDLHLFYNLYIGAQILTVFEALEPDKSNSHRWHVFPFYKTAKSLYGQKMQNMSFIWARDCKSALCFRNCEQDIIQFFNFHLFLAPQVL